MVLSCVRKKNRHYFRIMSDSRTGVLWSDRYSGALRGLYLVDIIDAVVSHFSVSIPAICRAVGQKERDVEISLLKFMHAAAH